MRQETKWSVDGQLYRAYAYRNVLKLDHFSLSYDEKNFDVFFMVHSVLCLCALYVCCDVGFSLKARLHYRHTQVCKLQLSILHNVPPMCRRVGLFSCTSLKQTRE